MQAESIDRNIGLVNQIIKNNESDKEMAIAIWAYLTENTKHYCSAGTTDPLRILELGFGCCDEMARALASLWGAAGLKSRVCYMDFHTVPEVYYEGEWYMMDPDQKIYYLKEDNATIASLKDIVEQPQLIMRTINDRGYNTPTHLARKCLEDFRNDSCEYA